MCPERLDPVLGARGREAARRSATGTDVTLVDADRGDEASRHPRFTGEHGVSTECGDQLGRCYQREDETVASQAFTDAAPGFEQACISKARSSRRWPVVPGRSYPSTTRSGIGVIGVIGI
jgi:hypothetical protein